MTEKQMCRDVQCKKKRYSVKISILHRCTVSYVHLVLFIFDSRTCVRLHLHMIVTTLYPSIVYAVMPLIRVDAVACTVSSYHWAF